MTNNKDEQKAQGLLYPGLFFQYLTHKKKKCIKILLYEKWILQNNLEKQPDCHS